MSEWQPIETAPKSSDWLSAGGKPCLIGRWNPQIGDDGEPYGEGEWSWVQVASLSFDGWRVSTGGFKSIHGFATFLLHEGATHWMPLPDPPEAG